MNDMVAYAQIASRYDVDPNDDDAVDLFFEETLGTLSEDERSRILIELLERTG